MLSMPDINHIHNLADQDYNISEISKLVHVDRKTCRKYLEMDDFSPKPPAATTRASIVDPFKERIDEILIHDSHCHRKQRHTNSKIFEILKEEGYLGSLSTLNSYLRLRRSQIFSNDADITYSRLIWGKATCQCDFGEIYIHHQQKRRKAYHFVVSFPYSNVGYAQVFFGTNSECICQALKDIFAYIGYVPRKAVFDNASGAGKRRFDEVTETRLFNLFRLH